MGFISQRMYSELVQQPLEHQEIETGDSHSTEVRGESNHGTRSKKLLY